MIGPSPSTQRPVWCFAIFGALVLAACSVSSPGATGGPGPTGPAGPIGPQGPQGADGPAGPPGQGGVFSVKVPDGGTLLFDAGLVIIAGPQGPQGTPGAQGAQGSQGAQGAQGAQGPQGPPGPAGSGVYAQLEAAPQAFNGGAWNVVTFGSPVLASAGWTVQNGSITFPQTGVYLITFTLRGGTCSDNWSALRLFDGNSGADVGHSAGFGWGASNTQTATFLANVQGSTSAYSIQLGYQSAGCTPITPLQIPGTPATTPPALQATLIKVG